MPQYSTKPPCTFYPNCNKGKSCLYSHPSPAKTEGSPSPKPLCTHFAAGTCAYGLKCRRSHTLPDNISGQEKVIGTSHTVKRKQKGNVKKISSIAPEDDLAEGTQDANEAVSGELASKNLPTSNSVKEVCHLYPAECDGTDCDFCHELPDTLENGSGRADSKSSWQHSTTESPSPKVATRSLFCKPGPTPQASIDYLGDDELTEQRHPPQDDYASPNGVDDDDDAGLEPESGPEDVDQLPTGGISKLPSNNARRAAALRNVIQRQNHAFPTPVSASRVPSNHTTEPVMIPQYPHISEIKLHWSQFADPCANSQVPFCKLHAQGACYVGGACSFRHSLTIQEYVALFHDQQPTLVTLRQEHDSAISTATTKVFYQASVPAPTIAPPESIQLAPPTNEQHVQTPRLSTFTHECKFYQIGKCRNGDRCPYEHTKHPPPELISSSEPDGGHEASAFHTMDRPKKPCRYFASKGFCSNGDGCKFLHENTPEPQSSTPNNEASENNTWSQQETNHNRWDESWEEGGGNGWNEGSATDANKGDWNTEPDNSAWLAPSNKSNGNEGHYDKRGPRESRKLPCHSYEKRGYCRYGESCKYAHDEPVISDHGGNDQVENADESTNQNSSTTVEEPPSSSEPLSQNDAAPDSGINIADGTCNSEPAAESNVETNWESNTGDDNGWANEWEQDMTPSNLPPAKSKAFCKDFGQGVGCKWGDTCRFIHDDPNNTISASNDDVPQVVDSQVLEEAETAPDVFNDPEAVPSKTEESDISELEPIVFDHPEVRKFMLGSTTTFGPDSTPESVETLAESCKLLVSNLPPGTSIADVRLLVHSFGGIPLEDSLRTTEYSTTIIVDFPDAKKARHALETLHRQTPVARMIVASLKASTESRFRVPSERPTLKVSWPKPSLMGWSHYPIIRKAREEVDRLNGVVLKGRAIHVETCPHDKRLKENFAIKFSNLHPETNKCDIEQLCEGHILITLDGPAYKGNPTDKIKNEIRDFGENEFDKLPDVEQSATSTAFITFATGDIASEVVGKLRSCPLKCLGDQALDIKQVYFSRYRIKRGVFDLLKPEIDRLQEKEGYTLQYNENYDAFCIRLSASKQATFVDVNAELCALLRGKIDETEWDDYFETSSCEKALQQLKTNAIIPDKVGRCIRIFGSKGDQVTAKGSLLKLLSKLHAARYEFDVPRSAMGPLVTGKFQTLLEKSQGKNGSGMNKFSFDVFRSKIIVRGTAKDLTNVKVFVDSLDLSPVKYMRGICEICYQKPDESTRLSCRHLYCKSCLRMAVAFHSHAPLQCIAYVQPDNDSTERCSAYVPYTIIHDLLSTLPGQEDRLLRSSLLTHVQRSDEIFTCPSIGCETILRTGQPGWNLLCSRCRTEICSFCKTLGHIGISCADMKE